ncbi:MAG TPA: DUF1080 domain-containing protein [Vicinamibacterales bacterium]|nr:DUF1080 domain-containing protein [Vicinamibacterales bacterium]
MIGEARSAAWFSRPRLVALAIAALLATGVHARQQSEWVSLFDGKTIAHWRGFKEKGVPAGWKVVDRAITRVAEGVDLVSLEQYADFEFEFEWKVPPGGNSGVMFHVTEALEQTYHSGPEFQILDNARHEDGKNPLTTAASSHSIAAPNHDMTKPVGEWNQSKLLVKGPHVEHWLNGMKVVEYELWSPEWKAKVKASKFNQWPEYGMQKTGHLVLQNHGDHVQFRNLRVRRLQ